MSLTIEQIIEILESYRNPPEMTTPHPDDALYRAQNDLLDSLIEDFRGEDNIVRPKKT